ncbi:hypothetical protein CAPTEDRAFT_212256 [Capitella teleta]|uniref:Uncharacterized protein n=1 Tax=Capitella teleta TaxID=283909 RepID=R7T705_CAPTE|nr:hypothetical protein CAPTEDRAFT_212256 [Capitella teleta]|eukprot:ELT89183.1 hypothetical protein CAPTEDRAFT_212256 [Capitella teleta]
MHSENASQLRYAARSFKLHAAMDKLVRESLAYIDTRVFALKELTFVPKVGKTRQSCAGKRFAHTRQCIEDVVTTCPRAAGRLRRNWEPIIRRMDCYCWSDSAFVAECHDEFQCLQRELSGKLVQHCDQMHAFNMQQNTKGKCFFAQELIDCKVSLVGSSCGVSSGHMIYHMTNLLIQAQPSTLTCRIHLHQHYKDGSAKDSGQINEVERYQAVCCTAIESHYIITGINVYASLVNIFVIKLSFAQELIDCKVSLVGSSCGVSSGHMIYHMTNLLIQAQPSTLTCRIHLHQHYKGYTDTGST